MAEIGMKRYIALVFVLLMMAALSACSLENAVLDETKTYAIGSDIHSLEIRISAADFTIRHAEAFSVESDLKYLSVSEKDGVLKIIDEAPKAVSYKGPTLILCIPEDTVFESIRISTGAAKLTSDALSGQTVHLQLGAGDVSIKSLNAGSDADIKGGAGRISIADGELNDLTLEMGVGEFNMTAALLGDSDLVLGVGETNLTLIGNKDDYKVDVEKGLGSVTVDGNNTTDFGSSGNGRNHVQIKGGVGAINLHYQAADL